MKPGPGSLYLSLACVVVLSADAGAQLPLASATSGITLEAGAFAYGRDRYYDDTEVRFAAAVGWRRMWSPFFVEPNVRVMAGLDGWGAGGGGCADDLCDGGQVAEPLPIVWPGLSLGVSGGGQRISHSAAVRAALGFGGATAPLLAFRYEASARRAGWYVEASLDRVAWDDEREFRWEPGVSAGGRFWLRDVSVPAPTLTPSPDLSAPDTGLLPPAPTPAEE